MARALPVIRRLSEHPDRDGVLAVLARLPHLRDAELVGLAARWRDGPRVAAARSRALSPDSPLVCDVLAAFDEVAELFADDLRGGAAYVTLDRAVTERALHAVRDAIAAAYAGPVLSRAQQRALLSPWRAVYPRPAAAALDLGPQSGEVTALLDALPRLSRRCHEPVVRSVWQELVDRSHLLQRERGDALTAGFDVAVATGRRRLWTLVRRTAAQLVAQPCSRCRGRPCDDADRGASALCTAAAGGLLVADRLPADLVQLLTGPLSPLPHPGRAGSST